MANNKQLLIGNIFRSCAAISINAFLIYTPEAVAVAVVQVCRTKRACTHRAVFDQPVAGDSFWAFGAGQSRTLHTAIHPFNDNKHVVDFRDVDRRLQWEDAFKRRSRASF